MDCAKGEQPDRVDPLVENVRVRLRTLRGGLSSRLLGEFDHLIDRMRLLSGSDAFSHPLAQPLVQFPAWTSAAVDHGPGREERLADMAEATVTGYLYVRVHDDRLDENMGDPDLSMFLADALLIRHQALLAGHVGTDPRFWRLFQSVARSYADAMLLEREVLRFESHYDAEVFDLVLARSQPLVLPGAALLSVTDRWDLLEPLQTFVRHVVRAGQLVDDLSDCLRDLDRGRYTWVVRRLDGGCGRDAVLRRLMGTGIDEVLDDVMADLDGASASALAIGMTEAVPWISARRESVFGLRDRMLLSELFG
jgi:hypothetical protein